MDKLIIVSNRLPIRIEQKNEKLSYLPSEGGLATGLASLDNIKDKIWIGWPGYVSESATEKEAIHKRLSQDKMLPVFLSEKDMEDYYEGFSNKTVWPLFHYFTEFTIYNQEFWKRYKKVNEQFCEEVLKVADEQDTIWVHDYQLMLLPGMIRKALPEVTIGFFLHIPFPSYEMFRQLPWRKEILEGILGSDLVGFHTFEYMRHFMSAVYRILGVEQSLGRLVIDRRIVNVDMFPMGIDYDKFYSSVQHPSISEEASMYKFRFGSTRLILSVDRLDYTKGIIQRLKAFNAFLERNPDLVGSVSLILVVVPSRSGVEQYQQLKVEVDMMVGEINGKFGALDWVPIHYFYRSLPFNSLSALYSISDVALVTPLRDGMNLVAKEYIASKAKDKRGVLILSEMAGAAIQLDKAIKINPNNVEEIVTALEEALRMSENEQITRNEKMQEGLKKQNVQWWAKNFLDMLERTHQQRIKIHERELKGKELQQITQQFRESKRRLLFLDYDGTLVDFQDDPKAASPDAELKKILNELLAREENQVVLISGRDKEILESWFKDVDVDIVAEHGVWLRKAGHQWQMIRNLSQAWKPEIRAILERFVDRTPGSFIETKDYSLVWHYRKTDNWIADIRVRELRNALLNPASVLNLQIMEGNKVLEIKNSGVNKGEAATKWIEQEERDFIFCIGDDWTDEDMFKVMPEKAVSIKVGFSETAAKYTIKNQQEVRVLLKSLAGVKEGVVSEQ